MVSPTCLSDVSLRHGSTTDSQSQVRTIDRDEVNHRTRQPAMAADRVRSRGSTTARVHCESVVGEPAPASFADRRIDRDPIGQPATPENRIRRDPRVGNAVDPRDILDRINEEHDSLRWEPLAPSSALDRWRQWPVKDDEALDFLHRNWTLPDQFATTSPMRGLRGRVLKLFARMTFRVLAPYLVAERELLANMVRLHDALAKRCDDISDEVARREVAEASNQAELAAWLHSQRATRTELDPGRGIA